MVATLAGCGSNNNNSTNSTTSDTNDTSNKEVECAFPVRSKNQYRLCFADGYIMTMTLNGAQTPTFAPQKYFYTTTDAALVTNIYEQNALVPAAVSSELDDAGEERIHIAPYMND